VGPDDKTGEAVRLFVVRRPEAELDDKMILAHCRDELRGNKMPRKIAYLEQLPKPYVGKILRRALRQGWPTRFLTSLIPIPVHFWCESVGKSVDSEDWLIFGFELAKIWRGMGQGFCLCCCVSG